jgi:hypothetical protein
VFWVLLGECWVCVGWKRRWEKEWPLEEGAESFAETRPTKLPFFKFIYVDDKVAVAQGRSGGVALWARHE